MNKMFPYLLWKYVKDIIVRIETKYNYPPMEALRAFLFSETYKMLEDPELVMWEFSPLGIFDMWETEQITGDPRNSLYLRRDEYVG